MSKFSTGSKVLVSADRVNSYRAWRGQTLVRNAVPGTVKAQPLGGKGPYLVAVDASTCDGGTITVNARQMKVMDETTERLIAAAATVRAIVVTGLCPDCGRKLRRNLSLSGWWQCSQYGAAGFRADPGLPSCNWQGFTE